MEKNSGGKAADFVGDLVKNNNKYLRVEKSDKILFTIESWGQLKPEEVLEEAVEVLKSNLEEVTKAK